MKNLMNGACLALLMSGTAALANDSVLAEIAKPQQWAIQMGDYANTRYSTLDQINKDNVKDLRVAWTFSTGVLRGHEGSPLVIGDVMYVHTPFPNRVFALDLNDNGKILWRYEPQQDPNVIAVMCCDTVYRGLSYADGMILLGQADTTVVALDATSGEVKWSTKIGDPGIGETLTATVVPVKDKVLVGISGGEYGVRGRMTALNLTDGSEAWKAWSTGPDEELLVDPETTTHLGKPIGADSSLNSWEGDQWQIGGGTIWGWFSYDPDLNLVYYGTGNPSTWNPSQRPGDNKWSMTIMARDADTGMAKWFYQMTPHDEWDYDGVNEMILTNQTVDGQERKLLTHFDRNGLAYTMDRETGELLVAEKYDPVVNWTTGVDMDPNSETYGRPAWWPNTRPPRTARTRTPPASALRHWAPRTSSRRPSRPRPTCSMCRRTTSAWITSRSGWPIPPASPMSAPRCPCIPRRTAMAAWATSSPGTTPRARSSGPFPSSSRSGRALWLRRATWSSTARWRAI